MDMEVTIISALFFGVLIFMWLKSQKEKEDRANHESWVFNVREAIHGIEYEFRIKCEDALDFERNFMGKIIINKYRQKIYELKDEYKNSLYEKVVARMWKYRVGTIPEYLEREYERNISDIANTFLHFCDVLSEQS